MRSTTAAGALALITGLGAAFTIGIGFLNEVVQNTLFLWILPFFLGLFGIHQFSIRNFGRGFTLLLLAPALALILAFVMPMLNVLEFSLDNFWETFNYLLKITGGLVALIHIVDGIILLLVKKSTEEPGTSGGVYVVVAIIAIAAYFILLHSLHDTYVAEQRIDVEETEAEFTMTSEELYAEFEADEEAATEKYYGKVIRLSGPVVNTGVEGPAKEPFLYLPGSFMDVKCNFQKEYQDDLTQLQSGEQVEVKCVCQGVLAMEVLMTQCQLLSVDHETSNDHDRLPEPDDMETDNTEVTPLEGEGDRQGI